MIKSISAVYDEFLGICTEVNKSDDHSGRKIFFEYGPTDYQMLETLFSKYPFEFEDHFVDFGCGKGRVIIMAAYHGCKHVTGYELDTNRYGKLVENVDNFRKKFDNESTFSISNINVEKVQLDDDSNKFWFFEPFHLKVYIRVLNEIQASLQRCIRNVSLFLYHPLESTVKYIDSLNYFEKLESSEFHNFPLNPNAYYYHKYVVYSNKIP